MVIAFQGDGGFAMLIGEFHTAAIHSFFRYAALRAHDHAALIQRVLSIPPKRFDRAIVSYLTQAEADALIAAPDRTTWLGRRDHALLLTDVQTGLEH